MVDQKRTLADLRKARQITQDELAARTGVAWATIAKLETGHHVPNLWTLKKLARELGNEVIDVDYGWLRPPTREGRPRSKAKLPMQSVGNVELEMPSEELDQGGRVEQG